MCRLTGKRHWALPLGTEELGYSVTQYEQQSLVLQRILDVSHRMAATRELDPLLNYIMQQALEFTRGEHGYLVLIDDHGQLDFRIVHGRPYEGNSSDSPVSHSIIYRAINRHETIIINDAGDSEFQNQQSVVKLRLRSVLCVPMIAQTEALGVIYLENREMTGAFVDNDRNLMEMLASQAAIAVKNAQLNERQQQILDDLEAIVQLRTQEIDHLRVEAELGWQAALETNRLRTALLSNITHDLRSPMTIVINTLGMMKNQEFGPVTDAQREWLGRSLNATQQILRLVNDIFDLSKLEQGELELFLEVLDVEPFIRQTMAIAQGMNREMQVNLAAQVEPNLPPISADLDRLQQILINLFSNAFKFTNQGNVILRVYLALSGNFVQFEMEDTGDGIPAEDLSHVFERFHQVTTSAQKRIGTGLGLAICRELVNRHGGDIWAESQLGVGTTFYFTIPVAQI